MAPRSSLVLAALLVAAAACVDPLTSEPVNTPEWTVKNTKGYAETALGLPPDIVYGWDLRVAAGVARWRECSSPEACSDVERERPAADLLGFASVGRLTRNDGGEVEVLKLSLSPRPKYVVPTKL